MDFLLCTSARVEEGRATGVFSDLIAAGVRIGSLDVMYRALTVAPGVSVGGLV
jgi:hypothetical protein